MKTIEINHIAKTEGHLSFVGALLENDFALARIETEEGSRLMESLVLNRQFQEVPIITSRICGVCPIVHNLASIISLEEIFEIKITEEIDLLRQALMHAQWIHSHALHAFFLSFPDVVGLNNNFDLLKQYPEESKLALEIRDFGLKLAKTIGGRTVHPINSVVGGFRMVPNKEELLEIMQLLPAVLNKALHLFSKIKKYSWLDFEAKSIFASLYSREIYPFWGEKIYFSDKIELTKNEFSLEIEELSMPNEKVKRVLRKQNPFFVGALSRINNNYGRLTDLAKQCFDGLNIEIPSYNPFHNIWAQFVEIINCLQSLIPILEKIKEDLDDIHIDKKIMLDYDIKAGRGSCLLEAPRGLLYHEYETDRHGKIVHCNIITPTAIFLANLEKDLREFLPLIKGKDDIEQKKLIKALIRSYDPCISCATH